MLHLKPADPNEIPALPKKNVDVSREVEQTHSLTDAFNIPPNAITPMRVQTGFFTVNFAINTRVPADRLVVTLHGARGSHKSDKEGRRPMYDRRDWDALFQAPVLAISDPVSELDWDSHLPRASMYTGTMANDLVPELHALINKVCDELGISRDRVVFYGSSAGGTSSLLVAARRKNATGVITNVPFLRPDKYRDEVVAVAARMGGGTVGDYERILEEQPVRYHPLTAIRESIVAGNDLRVVVAQNVRDKVTINKHFPGLWRRFDINPDGGYSPDGRIMAVLYDAPETGHGHEPPEIGVPLVKMSYEFFERKLAVTAGSGGDKPHKRGKKAVE
jgi:pimeloyl-ACP methyl ester carboxylesterase